jgi:hypothetical protein
MDDKDLAWMDDFCGFLLDPWKDTKIDLTTTKMKPAQGVACESLHTVKDGSPTDIRKGPTGCTGYNEPEIMKNTSPLYRFDEG